jgi:hypothetical protein
MSYSKLGIINLMLSKIGDARVEDITEDTEQRIAATDVWDYILDEVMGDVCPPFSRFRVRMLRMDVIPAFGFSYAYAIPDGFLKFVKPAKDRPSIYPNTLDPDAYPHIIQSLMVPSGLEKITNGAFTGAATNWTLGAQWSYGTNNVSKVAGGVSTLSQDASDMVSIPVIDETYLLSLDVDGLDGGNLIPTLGGAVGMPIGQDGVGIEQYITAIDATGLILTPSASGVVCDVDNASVLKCSEILAMYIDYADSDEQPMYVNMIRKVTDVTRFTPQFINALAFRGAAELALKITEGMAKYQAMMNLYGTAKAKAMAEAQSMENVKGETGASSWEDAGR